MIEFLIEIFGELLLQILFEGLAELGFHSLKRRIQVGPELAALGYFVLGVALGFLSLLILDTSFITSEPIKIANLLVTPIILGLLMEMIGRARHQKGKDIIRIEKFLYGYLFALGLALVRYFFAG